MEAVPLSFDEIRDWEQFQELVAAYFKACREDNSLNVAEVTARVTGRGPDGGCDVEVITRLVDVLQSIERKWVVQCKFHSGTVGLSEMASVNIPTLLHSHGAHGFLLICRGSVSSKLTDQFKALNEECANGRCYSCWTGEEFIQRIRSKPTLIEHFFPKHHLFILEREKSKLPPNP